MSAASPRLEGRLDPNRLRHILGCGQHIHSCSSLLVIPARPPELNFVLVLILSPISGAECSEVVHMKAHRLMQLKRLLGTSCSADHTAANEAPISELCREP